MADPVERLLLAVGELCHQLGVTPRRVEVYGYEDKEHPVIALPVTPRFYGREQPRREEQLPVSPPVVPRQPLEREGIAFQPNDFQAKILDALEFRALRSVPLGVEVGDKRDLYRHPGGIRELREHGLVKASREHGYYRPDMPPEELADAAED